MSVFNNGGGTLKATNLTQALLETQLLVVEADKALQQEQNIARKSTMSVDLANQNSTFAISIPMNNIINALGRPEMIPQNYLGPVFGLFDPGTGGTLKSVDLIAALCELVILVKDAEQLIPQTIATITPHTSNLTYNPDGKTAAITSSLPLSVLPNATTGGIECEAIDFLP